MKSKIVFSAFISTCIIFGCTKYKNSQIPRCQTNETADSGWCGTINGYPQPNPECNGTICSNDNITMNLEVLDNNTNPVLLDSFYIINSNNEKLPEYLYRYDALSSSYIVLDDRWVVGHQKTVDTIQFIGYKYGVEVVREPYVIDTDCCHIKKKSGKNKIIVQ